MAYIVGFILGEILGRIGFFRAAGAALLLSGTAFLAHRIVEANVDPEFAWGASIVAPLAFFGWAIWNPASSRLRLWIVDGVYLAARLAIWGFLLVFGTGLFAAEFRIGEWLTHGWPTLATAALMWGLQWVLSVQTARSHRIMRDRSVVEG